MEDACIYLYWLDDVKSYEKREGLEIATLYLFVVCKLSCNLTTTSDFSLSTVR